MKILLVQVDGKLPNLALMKISGYYKEQGHETGFNFSDPNKVFVSCIFQKNLANAKGIKTFYPNAEFNIGGPALWERNELPYKIEHHMPDYDLYPGVDYSQGYTQRGCPNACPFCIVPQLEGEFREHALISEFHNPDFNKLILYDNNFFASKLWREKLSYIEENGLKVCFNQGLDARLMDEERSAWLKDVNSFNLNFNHKTYYFAYDLMKNSDKILQGLRTVIEAGIKPYSIMVYILVGFNTSHEEDYLRFKQLRELGCDPFVMVYNNRRDDPWIRHFSRWVNKRVYKTCALEDYKNGELRTKSILCAGEKE